MAKIISKSEGHNPNYLAKVVKITNLRRHPNADRLLVFTVDGNDLITSSDTKEGQVSVYFPLEVAICKEYLSANNEYRKNTLLNTNADSSGGFFEEHGRVKALRLRGERSMGYCVPIETFEYILGDDWTRLEEHIGEEFDTIFGQLLVKKYIPRGTKTPGLPGSKDRDAKAKHSRLVDNQFRLHYDTAQLGKNLHKLQPDSLISITWKLHGTSWVSGRVLVKRTLKWYEKVAKWFGVKVQETEYGNVYSSRKVIKNESYRKTENHFYKYDLWGDINEKFKHELLDGETLYGEAVGFTKDGGFIQNGFDYKCEPFTYKVYVYRITHTSTSGKVIDLPFNLVQERCVQLNVESVPLIFFGRAKDFVSMKRPEFKTLEERMYSVEEWREEFINFLKLIYVHDQDSQFCNAIAPEEGIVLRVEGLHPEALKLKAFRFLEGESKALDKGEVNIEEQEAAEDE